MTARVKLANGTIIPTDNIKFFKPLSDEDRHRMKEKYGFDLSDRNIQVVFTNKTQKTAADSIDDIKAQVPLVNVGNERFVVAGEILSARQLTKADIEGAGVTTSQTFRSKVEFKNGGSIWSSAHASQVMDRRDKALETAAATAGAPKAQVS